MTLSNDDDFRDFFGCSPTTPQLKLNLWTQDDLSMGRAMIHHYQCHTLPVLQQQSTETCNATATSNGASSSDDSHSFPKIIHFIWLGSKQMPLSSSSSTNAENDEDENDCIRSWRRHHPTWSVKIWRDADICTDSAAQLLPSLHNKVALNHALQCGNYGMASDILRLEILWEHGGIYADIDYLCVAPMDDLLLQNEPFDFCCGASHTGAVELNNGLLAVTKSSHPFLLEQLMQSIHTWFTSFLQQSQPFHVMAAFLDPSSRSSLQQVTALTEADVIRNTGPGLLTVTVARALQQHDMARVAILPFSVFHPLPNTFRGQGHALLLQEEQQLLENHVVEGQTKAIHLWQCSWQQQPE